MHISICNSDYKGDIEQGFGSNSRKKRRQLWRNVVALFPGFSSTVCVLFFDVLIKLNKKVKSRIKGIA
jgi:hypothetical protein